MEEGRKREWGRRGEGGKAWKSEKDVRKGNRDIWKR